MHKYHYIYKIISTQCGMIYYGVHSTNNLNDGYMGSGTVIRNKIVKYGKKSMIKEIVGQYPTREMALIMESLIVNEGVLDDPILMNIRVGGLGNATYQTKTITEESRVARSNRLKSLWQDPEYRESMSKMSASLWDTPTEEQMDRIEKMRQSRLGSKHTDEVKLAISEKTHSSVIWILKWRGVFHYVVDSIVDAMNNNEIPFSYSVVFNTIKKTPNYKNRTIPVSGIKETGPTKGFEVCRFPDNMLSMAPDELVKYLYKNQHIQGSNSELTQLTKLIESTPYRFCVTY